MTSPFRLLHSRPIRFQLTSLMDLLLIIVFAQYLDFQRFRRDAALQQQQVMQQAKAALQSDFQQRREQLEAREQELESTAEQLRADTQQAQWRQELTETLVKRLLDVDESLLDPTLSPPEAADTLEQTRRRAEEIESADPTKLLRLLAGYDELLKRAEVWTLHVSDRGLTELQPGSAPNQTQQFRLESATQEQRAEEFVEQFRAAYSQLPQPKGLVVILVSFSPRAIAGNYQPVLDAMPKLIEWLETDSGDRTQFEYAVLGAVADPARDLPAVD